MEDPSNPPEFWAHHTLMAMLRRVGTVNLITYRRAMRQLGTFIPPNRHINSGIGPRFKLDGRNSTSGLVFPNKFLKQDREEFTIAGKY